MREILFAPAAADVLPPQLLLELHDDVLHALREDEHGRRDVARGLRELLTLIEKSRKIYDFHRNYLNN